MKAKNIICLLGLHKWGFEHWGIRICKRCGKVDTHHGSWGEMRKRAEERGTRILRAKVAREHWKDLELCRISGNGAK